MKNKDFGEVPVIRPSWSEFSNFEQLVQKIAPLGKAHGLVKVIPPAGWCARKGSYEDINITIPVPIQQFVQGQGQGGCFKAINVENPSMTVKQFSELASDSEVNENVSRLSHDELERKFWKNIQFNPPLYGADMVGSLTDENVLHWNMRSLPTILKLITVPMEGVNIPYLYFGMWKAFFAWHTEDMDLYSINYLHYGKPKRWYAIPPDEGKRFENFTRSHFPMEHKSCKGYLRHKTTMINPRVLLKSSIPVNTCVQEQGQFIITFPYAYHAGFNHGFNCAESINFAMPNWIEYGCKAQACTCSENTVKIDMQVFIALYQLSKEGFVRDGQAGSDKLITDELLKERIARNAELQEKQGIKVQGRGRKRTLATLDNDGSPDAKKQKSEIPHDEDEDEDEDQSSSQQEPLPLFDSSMFHFSSQIISPTRFVIKINRNLTPQTQPETGKETEKAASDSLAPLTPTLPSSGVKSQSHSELVVKAHVENPSKLRLRVRTKASLSELIQPKYEGTACGETSGSSNDFNFEV